ncbi:MAG: beta-lactamase family protein [Chitinophagales bacterium]|nr:beta-lactamase family protein [Chitinophagales bacterium]MCZ2394675.1 beta-lactamase family protein [Chitinophagales bacterium]
MLKTIIYSFLILFLASSCSSLRIPTIYDGKIYGTQELQIASTQHNMLYSKATIPDLKDWAPLKYSDKYSELDKMLEKSNTTSFLILKDGKIVYEKYFNGIDQGDQTQIFSVSKVFITTALAMAIQEGKIKSIDQPVSDFIPEFKEGKLSKITLFHLAQMRSGIDYDEYGKLMSTLKFYYLKDVSKAILHPNLAHEPGEVYTYKSIDTQILGTCISKAVGQPLLDYLEVKIFSKLGMEDPVAWSVDSKTSNNPKFYGGLNISARDLAKFGNLIVNNGKKDGKQILSPYTNTFCVDADCRDNKQDYCNGWWYSTWDEKSDVYYAAGFKGQIMMINKSTGVVIIRLGENKGGLKWYEMLKNLSNKIDQNDIYYTPDNMAIK